MGVSVRHTVLRSTAAITLATCGGAVAGVAQTLLRTSPAAATDVPGCTYNFDEGSTGEGSPQIFWTFPGGTQTGTVKDHLGWDCTPTTSPPYALAVTSSQLWKDYNGTWTQQDPASGANGGLGIWSASDDDSSVCGTVYACTDGSTWKQVWNTSITLTGQPWEIGPTSGGCIGAGTEVSTCSGANYLFT
jgi:hypothetical protein